MEHHVERCLLKKNNNVWMKIVGKIMELKKLDYSFSVCKVENYTEVDLTSEFCFIGKTDEELSLVCLTECAPSNTTHREDGWKGFRIQGILDFSLIGILSKISGKLSRRHSRLNKKRGVGYEQMYSCHLLLSFGNGTFC